MSGPAELNRAIVESGKVEACLAQGYFEYVMRRAVANRSLDACVVQDLTETLAREGGGLEAAFRGLGVAASFTQRRVGAQ